MRKFRIGYQVPMYEQGREVNRQTRTYVQDAASEEQAWATFHETFARKAPQMYRSISGLTMMEVK